MTHSPSDEESARTIVDFVVIGAMKSGTTTLHAWLDEHSGTCLASWKEPSFFSREDQWARGVEWYRSLFVTTPDAKRGEASTSYTDPRFAAVAAQRMHTVAPDARLIYLVRDPIERARSHYRHQVQRGRERRSVLDALSDPENPYTMQSKYWSCLEPYIKLFDPSQILVVRMEDLVGDSEAAWLGILQHIELRPIPRPEAVRNVTALKPRYTWLMGKLWKSGILSVARLLPTSVRRIGAKLLLRRDDRYLALLEQSDTPLPSDITEPMWSDVSHLERWLSRGPMWGNPQSD